MGCVLQCVLLALACAQEGDDETSPEAPSLEAFRTSGFAEVGWRFLEVRGDGAQFDEDLNLEKGPFLRGFELAGERSQSAGTLSSFALGASGWGEPDTSLFARAGFDAFDAAARFDRRKFEGHTESDLHPFDVTRERGSLTFSNAASDAIHASLALDWLARDGFQIGTRAVDLFFVENVLVRQDERRLGARGNLGFEADGAHVELSGGLSRLRASDHRNFEEPNPFDPTFTQTEDFDASTEGIANDVALHASEAFLDERLEIEVGLGYEHASNELDLVVFESGISFAPPEFESLTLGDGEQESADVHAELAATYALSDASEVFVALEHARERIRGHIVNNVTIEQDGASSTTETREAVSHAGVHDLASLGLLTALSTRVELDLELEVGHVRERLTNSADGVGFGSSKSANALGARATLDIELSRAWNVELASGYALAPTEIPHTTVFLDLADDVEIFGSAGTRFRPGAQTSLAAKLKHSERRSQLRDSTARIDALSLSASLAPSELWSADATFVHRDIDLRAETISVERDETGFPEFVPFVTTYDGTETVLGGSVSFALAPELRPTLGASGAFATGDAPIDYGSGYLLVPWKPEPSLEVGLELSYYSFDGAGVIDASDYDAALLVVYLKRTF